MKKPIIGISGSELTKNGGVPMIIPFNEDADVTESQLELVDALILSGG